MAEGHKGKVLYQRTTLKRGQPSVANPQFMEKNQLTHAVTAVVCGYLGLAPTKWSTPNSQTNE